MNKAEFKEKYEELQKEYASVGATMQEEYIQDLEWLICEYLEGVE